MRKELLFFVLLLPMFSACKEKTYHSQLKLLYKHSVPVITPGSLAQRLATDSLLVLDTRSLAEWEVSHISGASHIAYDGFDVKSLQELSRQQPLAVYCTIGYRSEKIGKQLKDAGFEQVYNLYGGLIEWKNRGLKVVDAAGKPTEEVHTFNSYWGIYLSNGKQVHEK
jgi:rhodanese-related sulfurtransferase